MGKGRLSRFSIAGERAVYLRCAEEGVHLACRRGAISASMSAAERSGLAHQPAIIERIANFVAACVVGRADARVRRTRSRDANEVLES